MLRFYLVRPDILSDRSACAKTAERVFSEETVEANRVKNADL